MLKYSKEIAGKILEGFNKKGWDLYEIDIVQGKLTDMPVRTDLEEMLETRVPYMMQPKSASKDHAKLSEEAAVQEKSTLNDQTITIGDLTYELSGITLMESGVYINPHEDVFISYPAFIGGLDSLTEILETNWS